MVQSKWSFKSDFPSVDKETWRARVEQDLKGKPFEKKLVSTLESGLSVQPLYTRGDWPGEDDPGGLPGAGTRRRGSSALGAAARGLDILQRVASADPAQANAIILEELARGATSIWLRCDRAARTGDEAGVGVEGVAIHDQAAFTQALTGLRLGEARLAVEAGVSAGAVAGFVKAHLASIGEDAPLAGVSLGVDPLGSLAACGVLSEGLSAALDEMAALAVWADERGGVQAAQVDTSVYHHAGADEAQTLAISLATGLAYVRALCAAGLSVEAAFGQISFHYRVGSRFFLSIAKLRAARVLWARAAEVCGAPKAAMVLRASPSERAWTRRDPWVNMLRNTSAVFAATVGGADAITSLPFDAALGDPDDLGRRIARNTPIVLEQESGLHRVVDPAGGAWFIETLTDKLAVKSWAIFQEIEGLGGAAAALTQGWIQAQVNASAEDKARAIARRKTPITGVSEFPHLGEVPVRRAVAGFRYSGTSLASKRAAHPSESATHAVALEMRRDAAPYETFRDKGDAQAESGGRPKVFSANLGPIAQHTARASFARNLLEAGGFEVSANDGFTSPEEAAEAFGASGAEFAVLCSSDAIYREMAVDTVGALKAAGARQVLLAGRTGKQAEALEAAGLSDSLYMGCDALAVLGRLWADVEGGRS